MTRFLTCLAAALLLEASAYAQVAPNEISISSFNPEDAVAPASTVEGPGIKVGEGTVLRPVFGVETGFVSNVFYEDGDPQAAGLLRLIAQIGAGSLGKTRLHPSSMISTDDQQPDDMGQLEYRASLRLSYDLLLSDNETVSDTGGLGIGATVKGMVNPSGRFAFGFEDDFHRLIRAANFETDVNTNRDLNYLRLLLMFQPRDHAISGYLYYTNTIDVFESSNQAFADRMMNRVGIHPQWRFLPQTQAYLDLSWGAVTPLGETATKDGSYPLILRAGLATLLSLKTTLNIDAGYTNGFYSNGPSFSAPVVGAQVGYRYSPLGRASLGYNLVYEDSINANYYRDHVIHASVQQLMNPFILMIQPELHFRTYEGVTSVPNIMPSSNTRNDLIFAMVGGVHYQFRDWFTATLNYRFSLVDSDLTYVFGGMADDPSFARHELLAGLRIAM